MSKFKISDFTKLTFDSPKVRKKAYTASLLLFSLFVSSTFLMHSAFAAVSEGCELFDVKLECDLSW